MQLVPLVIFTDYEIMATFQILIVYHTSKIKEENRESILIVHWIISHNTYQIISFKEKVGKQPKSYKMHGRVTGQVSFNMVICHDNF